MKKLDSQLILAGKVILLWLCFLGILLSEHITNRDLSALVLCVSCLVGLTISLSIPIPIPLFKNKKEN